MMEEMKGVLVEGGYDRLNQARVAQVVLLLT